MPTVETTVNICRGCGDWIIRPADAPEWTDPTLAAHHAGCRPGAGRIPNQPPEPTPPTDPFGPPEEDDELSDGPADEPDDTDPPRPEHRITAHTLPDGRIEARHWTNDDNDDGYIDDEPASWITVYRGLDEFLRDAGPSRAGVLCDVTVRLDGVEVTSRDPAVVRAALATPPPVRPAEQRHLTRLEAAHMEAQRLLMHAVVLESRQDAVLLHAVLDLAVRRLDPSNPVGARLAALARRADAIVELFDQELAAPQPPAPAPEEPRA